MSCAWLAVGQLQFRLQYEITGRSPNFPDVRIHEGQITSREISKPVASFFHLLEALYSSIAFIASGLSSITSAMVGSSSSSRLYPCLT